MSKERMVQVTKEEYENLIRDQHTVELLTGYVQEQSWMIDSTICLLLGIQKSERELPPGWDPEPESETVTEDIPLPAMEEPVLQLDFRVWGTREQLMGLRQYMVDNKIKFGKVE